MINSIVVAPTFLRSSCAVGQIERHFFPNLPEDFYSHIICANDELRLEGDRFLTHILPESRLVLKFDLLFRKLGWTDLVYSPDSTYYSWYNRALRKAASIVQNTSIDYIHTINNPVSAHLIGYEIKKKYGIPWIAQFFDPWSHNAFRVYRHSFFSRIDARRERLVAEHADLILLPNQELLDAWKGLYGEVCCNKLFVLPFTTEVPDMMSMPSKSNQGLTIAHIGTLSENRRADVFFRAVSRLLRTHPEDNGKLKINIVGCITEEDKKIIVQEGIQDVVNIIGRVSEEDCLKYYKTADVFLIIDIDCSPNLFYPSKLLKYFCFQKPIVGLTQRDSVVSHELSKTGNISFDYYDDEGLAEYIHIAINDYKSINHNDKFYYQRFLVNNTTTMFRDCLSHILTP